MADVGEGDEDQWLYGDSNPDQPNVNKEGSVDDASKNTDAFINPEKPEENEPQPPGVLEPPVIPPPSQNGEAEGGQGEKEEGSLQIDEGHEPPAVVENGEVRVESGEFEEDDDDSEDDTVNVVIGDIRTAPQYSNLNIKRGALVPGLPPQLKQPGKFSIEEFEQIGTINGVPAHEYNLDSLEDKPWRKPGADITDYFNYGFNEDTWRAYCERQKRMRIQESGVGLGPLSSNVTAPMSGPRSSSASEPHYIIPSGPPPHPQSRRGPTGCIDVIGGQSLPTRRTNESPPKENVIQPHHYHGHSHSSSSGYKYVMTADRREYSRKDYLPGPLPGGMPPPGFTPSIPPPHLGEIPPPGFEGAYAAEFYQAEVDPYYAYEPTQDSQWTSSQALDKVIKQEPLDPDEKPRERDRDRDRERDRERERHRERDRERHRHRSRSRSTERGSERGSERATERRSRKHKSRSRSPGHRSHKKKKSKKSDRQKEETSE